MSEISRKIIDAVRAHLDEHFGSSSHIPMEGDLETEIDTILLDAVFPVAETAE